MLEQIIQRVAFQQLHGHEDGAALAVEIMHGNNIGVGELLGFHSLLLQRDKSMGMIFKVLPQNLSCDIGVAVFRFDFA